MPHTRGSSLTTPHPRSARALPPCARLVRLDITASEALEPNRVTYPASLVAFALLGPQLIVALSDGRVVLTHINRACLPSDQTSPRIIFGDSGDGAASAPAAEPTAMSVDGELAA
jgi:hypothetical protein